MPRIDDLAEVKDFLDKNVPEMKVAVAHGQMPPTVIEDIMSAFYDGKYDVLLSTTIVESGLDIPTANTLIVHRADMFGLAQLYQLRGRVGRSKLRAYALFTLPAQHKITAQAERRLKVLQSLDTLGAGFQLASHDLDIRGAGNLLGEEQSGHIKEVGFELYQSMLEEAILNLKAGVAEPAADRWSPQITVGMPVLIPEDFVAILQCGSRCIAGWPISIPTTRSTTSQPKCGTGLALAGRSSLPFQSRRHQGLLPPCQRREGRCGAEGRRYHLPRQQVRATRPVGLFHPPAWTGGEGSSRHEGRVFPGLGNAGGAADRYHRDHAPARQSRGRSQGGVMHHEAARCASSFNRARSDFTESSGRTPSMRHEDRFRNSRLAPCAVCFITLESRRAIIWASRKSVSVKTTMIDPSFSSAPKSIRRINRLKYEPRRIAGVLLLTKRESGDGQSSALGLGLMDRRREFAMECLCRQQAGPRVEQSSCIQGFERSIQTRLESVLPDQGKKHCRDLRGFARDHLKIGKVIGGAGIAGCDSHRQIAKLRVSSASTVRNASTTRGLKPSPMMMPSRSRALRCFAAASMLSAPTTPRRSPNATDSAGYAGPPPLSKEWSRPGSGSLSGSRSHAKRITHKPPKHGRVQSFGPAEPH